MKRDFAFSLALTAIILGTLFFTEWQPPPSSEPIRVKRYTALSGFDAETIADLFDMSQSGAYSGPLIQKVHALRPDYIALLYRNLQVIPNSEFDMAYEKGWILYDNEGNLALGGMYGTSYMADIGNPDYQKHVGDWCKYYIDLYGFDGVHADVSLHHEARAYWWHVTKTGKYCINPRTGLKWTDEEFIDAEVGLHNAIKDAIGPNKWVKCNQIYGGKYFWDYKEVYEDILTRSKLDGASTEGCWYNYNGKWYSEEVWKQNLDMVVWLHENWLKGHPNRWHQPMLKFVKMADLSIYPLPPGCTQEQLFTYAYCSTLLGATTNQAYQGITLLLPQYQTFVDNCYKPLYEIEVGAPLGSYYVVEGTHVYARDFTEAKVMVNPTGNSYVVDGVTVAPHTGIIQVA